MYQVFVVVAKFFVNNKFVVSSLKVFITVCLVLFVDYGLIEDVYHGLKLYSTKDVSINLNLDCYASLPPGVRYVETLE